MQALLYGQRFCLISQTVGFYRGGFTIPPR